MTEQQYVELILSEDPASPTPPPPPAPEKTNTLAGKKRKDTEDSIDDVPPAVGKKQPLKTNEIVANQLERLVERTKKTHHYLAILHEVRFSFQEKQNSFFCKNRP